MHQIESELRNRLGNIQSNFETAVDFQDAVTVRQIFAFMGRQYQVELGEKEYFYDLLFYHTRLRRYFVVELKIGDLNLSTWARWNSTLKLRMIN